MKRLHLLRHAKSAWDDPGLDDRERGLNKRGRRDGLLMGAALSELLEPTAISVSVARRAQHTLAALCDAWPALAAMEHSEDEELYTFHSDNLVRWIARQNNSLNSAFIIGHNPALTDLINTLLGRVAIANLPTAGYVQLALDIDQWGQLLHCVPSLEYHLFPKHLK
ncbi:MAG: histidine phosphatase family protein [Halioglobus sp.]